MPMQTFSYWEQTAFTGHADLIIIGSGLVGLSAALNFKQLQPNARGLVLERGFLPSGASTKNAGLPALVLFRSSWKTFVNRRPKNWRLWLIINGGVCNVCAKTLAIIILTITSTGS